MRTAVAILLIAVTARAEEADDPRATEVVIVAPSEAELSTGMATVVRPSSNSGVASVADLLDVVPGVHVQRSGSLGSFSALRIRGMFAGNVAVVIDDVPLSSATFSPVSLGSYSAAGVERVELYRGAGPVRFDAAMGGVVRVVTKPPSDRLRLALDTGYGSWQTRSMHASAAGPVGATRWAAALGYEASEGDFLFYDDRATPYTAADDRSSRRRNNAATLLRASLAGEADGPAGGTLALRLWSGLRDQGMPSVGNEQTKSTHADERELVARLALDEARLWDGALLATLGVDGFAARRAFSDPLNEAHLSVIDVRSTLWRFGTDARLQWLLSEAHELELAPRGSLERFRQRGEPSFERAREQASLGVEYRGDLREDLRLVASLRAESARDTGPGLDAHVQPVASPRLGAEWQLGACALSGNLGLYHRFPTPLERFGDGERISASPDLAPERGASGDVGATCRGELGEVPLSLELAGFATRASDLIALNMVSRNYLKPVNIGAARIAGVEAAARAATRYARGELAYTYTFAQDQSRVDGVAVIGYFGNRVPGIPEHKASGSLEVGPKELSLRYGVRTSSLFYYDRGNLNAAPARLLHDVEARAELSGGLELALTIDNLTDVMTGVIPVAGRPGTTAVTSHADFTAYPLPGRSLFVSLAWRTP